MPKFFLLSVIVLSIFYPLVKSQAGTLSCTVATSCPTGTIVYRLSSTTNAHAEISSQANYPDLACCSGVTGLGTTCSGTHATVLKLQAITNAQVEQNSQSNYGTDVCLSVTAGGSVSVGYQASNCTGYDTTVGSMSAVSNAHTGDSNAYDTKICATAAAGDPQSLTFSISDNTIGFGTLSASTARYATGDSAGAGADSADAHTISIATNAASGYVMSVSGTTLTCDGCAGATVNAIGATAIASSVGTEQYGLRATVNSGTGSVSAPYSSSNWAFDTAAFPDQVAGGDGDAVTTIFGLRYIGNVSADTEAGSYSAVLTYVVTATF